MATIEKYETASGATLYRVRYRTPDHRSTQKRGFATKRDAERFANTVEVSKMTGEYVAPRWGTVAVADVDVLGVESWIAGMVRAGSGATRCSARISC